MTRGTTIDVGCLIRPATERQLRMFQRTLGPLPEETTRVIAPKGAKSILLSRKEASSEGAEMIAKKMEGRIATVKEVVMDLAIVEKLKTRMKLEEAMVFVDCSGVRRRDVWHQIDRKNKRLIEIDEEQAKKLPWNERLFVGSGD